MDHSMPTFLTSSLVLQFSTACTRSSGRSIKNMLGKMLNCLIVVRGFNPGIIGTLIPAALHSSTNLKNFELSKNI